MCVCMGGKEALLFTMTCHNIIIIIQLEHFRQEIITFVCSHAWHRLVCSGTASFNALPVILIVHSS